MVGERRRVELEPLRADHVTEMLRVLADPALYRFTGGEPPTREALARRYRVQIAGPGRDGERWLNWIVRRVDTNDAVGFVQATVLGDQADIAWLIGVDHQAQGFATEASGLMVDELASFGVRTLAAHIHREHRRSQGVARAIGMTPSGAVDDEGEEIWTGAVLRRS